MLQALGRSSAGEHTYLSGSGASNRLNWFGQLRCRPNGLRLRKACRRICSNPAAADLSRRLACVHAECPATSEIVSFRGLTSLDLTENNMTYLGAAQCVDLANLQRGRVLLQGNPLMRMEVSPAIEDPAFWARTAFGVRSSLTFLAFYKMDVKARGARYFALMYPSINDLTNLAELHIDCIDAVQESASGREIPAPDGFLSNLEHLTRLNLRRCLAPNGVWPGGAWAGLESLEHLEIEGNRLLAVDVSC